MMLAPAQAYSIETCLEPEAMRTLLQQALPQFTGRCVTIDKLRVVSARRNASRRRNPNPLSLQYEVDVHDPATGNPDKLRFYGKVYRDGASAAAVCERATLHVPQLDMVLWRWPADPGLPQLETLLDPGQACRFWGDPARDVRVLRYEPEKRATLCYRGDARHGTSGRLYAKTFGDCTGETLQRRFAHFWHQAEYDPVAPAVGQPLGYCPATRTFWQAPAPGQPLQQVLASAAAAGLPAQLAQAIAAVHRAPVELAGPALHDKAHWLTETRRRHKKISRAVPEMAGRAARVAQVIEQVAAVLPPLPQVTLHGDFHPDQAWHDGTRVVLFDFDEFALGDPMEDLAAFLARLGALAADATFVSQFVAAYARLVPEHYCPLRLQWHRTVQQLLQASRAFAMQVPDWRQALERRLAYAEALCMVKMPGAPW